jgi:hypothetical protein
LRGKNTLRWKCKMSYGTRTLDIVDIELLINLVVQPCELDSMAEAVAA